MREHSDRAAPVGVVQRRRAPSIHPLMSDTLDAGEVTEEIRAPHDGAGDADPAATPLYQKLSTAATLGLAAAVLEWLKLTR